MIAGERFGDLVIVGPAYSPPARRPSLSPRYHVVCVCGVHLGRSERLLRAGQDVRCTHQPVSHQLVHIGLVSIRGRASQHRCVDCGRVAQDWSYDYSCPNEIVRRRPNTGVDQRFSLDPAHYDPRCRSCHVAFDIPRTRKKNR